MRHNFMACLLSASLIITLPVLTIAFSYGSEEIGIAETLNSLKSASKDSGVISHINNALSALNNGNQDAYISELKNLASADKANADTYNGLRADVSGPAGIYYKLALRSPENTPEVKDIFAQALEKYRSSDIDGVRSLLKKVTDQDADNPAALMFLQELDDEQFTATDSELFTDQAKEHYEKAMKLYRMDDYDKALAEFTNAYNTDPVNKKIKKFMMLSRRSDEIGSESVESMLERAGRLADENDFQDAYDIYCRVIQVDPKNDEALSALKDYDSKAEALVKQSKQLFSQGNHQDAYMLAIKAIAYSPKNKNAVQNEIDIKTAITSKRAADILYNQGVDLYTAGKYDLAINAWERVLVILPDDQQTRGNITKAQQKLADINAQNEKAIKDNLKSGGDYLGQGILDKATSSYQYVLRLDPSNSAAIDGLNTINQMQAQGFSNNAVTKRN